MQRIDVVYALITNEECDKVLMVRNIRTTSWSLPGGAVEAEESLAAAAIREAKEETGLDVELLGICAVNECVFEDNGKHAVFMTFKAKILDGEFMIIRPNEIAEVKWVDISEANLLMPYYKNGFEALIKSNTITYNYEGKQ